MSRVLNSASTYVVYCDESRHDGHRQNTFLGIGSLWLPYDQRDRFRERLDRIAAIHSLHGEIKWSKVSTRSLPGYKEMIDAFADEPNIGFRIILVPQAPLNFEAYHDGDRELGFYKFYYELLIKWLRPGADHVILLDHMHTEQEGRHVVLRQVLERTLGYAATIRQLTYADSGASRVAQLADLLTGAVTASKCGIRAESPKAALAKHIAIRTHRSPLHAASSSPAFGKFNVFCIRLRDTFNGGVA